MTDTALLLLSNQPPATLCFFLSTNMRIARDRAWEHTARSRGKGPECWARMRRNMPCPRTSKVGSGSAESARTLGGLLLREDRGHGHVGAQEAPARAFASGELKSI
ncbi:hypothetical protein DFH11DRAFT_1731495 [Phellopilus nigrolimitatus]|nr:hypothetical protein DFH11DRAFT_1731495 [Phellopilus nigrolimitatus]